MEPDLRLLRSFVVVAEERHFGRAAERLGIAQPPLSQQIQKLETQLGFRLIDRTTRPVTLTNAGTALLAEAQLALAHAERALTAGRHAAQGRLGHLTVGAMQSALCHIVPETVRAYRSRFPHVSLTITEEGRGAQIARLLEDRLDIGFVRGLIDDPALIVEPLINDPLAAVLPANHELAERKAIDPADLMALPLVLPVRATSPTTYADTAILFRLLDAEPHIADEASTVQTVLALVAGGLGVSLLPASFSQLRRGGVTFKPLLTTNLPPRPIVIARRAANQSETLATFVDVAREIATKTARAPVET